MNEKQISKEMADRLLYATGFNPILISQIKDIWSKNNLIEESALDKARKGALDLISVYSAYSYPGNKIREMVDFFEQNNAELSARIKKLEEGKR